MICFNLICLSPYNFGIMFSFTDMFLITSMIISTKKKKIPMSCVTSVKLYNIILFQ